ALLRALAGRLAAFHDGAEAGPDVARHARFDAVAFNCRENVEQLRPFVGSTVSSRVLARLAELTETELARRRDLIEARAQRGVARDGHGDLRLEHAFHLPGWDLPLDLAVVDCVEFNDRFRCADPVADVAFLVMELELRD